MKNISILDEAKNAAASLAGAAANLFNPTLRLGVTGFSRAGKTVFITSLVHNLLHGGALPLFEPARAGRIRRAYLEPQPDAHLPRFAYEDHIAALTAGEARRWPKSTAQLSQLRITVDYQPQGFLARRTGRDRLHIDIVDYPGEWLLDLPLLDMDYATWSDKILKAARQPSRKELARPWLDFIATLDIRAPLQEQTARRAAALYRAYLEACRANPGHFSALQPGRFLMPGDLEGSPLLTFCPLPAPEGSLPAASLWRQMERRYLAYVRHVARPFFFDHFARLDSQVVLADILTALNGGAGAVRDLKGALASVLACLRTGASSLLARRAARVLFCATKADLIHHESHERLRAILALLIEQAARKAEYAGAAIETTPLAAIRATREGTAKRNGEELPVIIGIPEKGEEISGEIFDGKTQAAIFPGDLPDDPRAALDGSLHGALRFVRFRPPLLAPSDPLARTGSFPHIHLDSALQFLTGEWFS